MLPKKHNSSLSGTNILKGRLWVLTADGREEGGAPIQAHALLFTASVGHLARQGGLL